MKRTIVLDARNDETGLGDAWLLLEPIEESGELHWLPVTLTGSGGQTALLETLVTMRTSAGMGGQWQPPRIVYVFDLYDKSRPVRIGSHIDRLAALLDLGRREFPSCSPDAVALLAIDRHEEHEAKDDPVVMRLRDLDARGFLNSGELNDDSLYLVSNKDLDTIDGPWIAMGASRHLSYTTDRRLGEQQDITKNKILAALDETRKNLNTLQQRLTDKLKEWAGSYYDTDSVAETFDAVMRKLNAAFDQQPIEFLLTGQNLTYRPSRLLEHELGERFSAPPKLRVLHKNAALYRLVVSAAEPQDIRKQLAFAIAALHGADDVPAEIQSDCFTVKLTIDDELFKKQFSQLRSQFGAEEIPQAQISTKIPPESDDVSVSLPPPHEQAPDLVLTTYGSGTAEEKRLWAEWRKKAEEKVASAWSELNNLTTTARSRILENTEPRDEALTASNEADWRERQKNIEAKIEQETKTLMGTFVSCIDPDWVVNHLEPLERNYLAKRERTPSTKAAWAGGLVALFLVALALLSTYYVRRPLDWQEYASAIVVIGLLILSIAMTHARHRWSTRRLATTVMDVVRKNLEDVDNEAENRCKRLKSTAKLQVLRARRDAIESALADLMLQKTTQASREQARTRRITSAERLAQLHHGPSGRDHSIERPADNESMLNRFRRCLTGSDSYKMTLSPQRTELVSVKNWLPIVEINFEYDPMLKADGQ